MNFAQHFQQAVEGGKRSGILMGSDELEGWWNSTQATPFQAHVHHLARDVSEASHQRATINIFIGEIDFLGAVIVLGLVRKGERSIGQSIYLRVRDNVLFSVDFAGAWDPSDRFSKESRAFLQRLDQAVAELVAETL